jgi:diguanylate cyclase (GGDEF)-like protein/PAS domain S-box-containing protein
MQGSINSGSTRDSYDTDINSSPNKPFFTIYMVFFVFLSLVLTAYGWHQWNEAGKNYKIDMIKTVDSFVAQASITAKASTLVNQIFSQTHTTELISLINEPTADVQFQLRQKVNKNFFNLSGYMLVDDKGEILFFDGPLLSENEALIIKRSVANNDHSNRFFAHHYGDNGGFYSISWITQDDRSYGFIVRRPYNKFSALIYGGGFAGYQLALYDLEQKQVIITEGHYLTDRNALPLESLINRVEYRRKISASPWELIAVRTPGYMQSTLLNSFLPSIVILTVFLLVLFILRIYLRTLIQDQVLESTARRKIEQRADKSLMSIDEAIITTDENNLITYINPKASQIFGHLGAEQVIGEQLATLWPDENSLWSRYSSVKELEFLQEEPRELHVQVKNDNFIFEQSYNLLYEDSKVSGVVWLLRDVTDAVINRRALEDSRTRYKAIFDKAAIAHCIINIPQNKSLEHSRIINTNDAAIALFHAHDQQHLTHAFPQLMSRQVSSLQENIQRTLDDGKSWNEFEIKVSDFLGKNLVLWVNVSLYTGSEQNAVITFIDITKRDKASAELFQREQFWARIMDEIVDMIYVLSLDERLVPNVEYRNNSVNELFGIPEPTSTSMAHSNLKFHPDDHEKILTLIKKTRNLSPKETAIETCRVKDGDDHWRIIRFTNTAFDFDDKGYVCRYISSVRDVTEEEKSQIALFENERRYRLLAENVTDVIWSIDTQLKFTFISSSIFSMLGYTPDEIYRGAINGVFTLGDLKKVEQRVKVGLRNATSSNRKNGDAIFKIDMNATCKDGQQLIVEAQANFIWDENENLEGIFGIVRNVTKARHIERELLLAGQVFDNSTEAIIVTDNKGYVINANPAFFEGTQFTLDEVRGLRPDDIINQKFHGRDFYTEVGQAVLEDSYWQGEVHYLRKNGEERVSWTGVSATLSRSGKVQNLIIIVSDITERKVIERRVHKLAYFDPLTGLPNRSQMYERLDQMVIAARENKTHIAVLFLDLDRFKPINDSMGHPAGDRVLKEVANRLQNCIKKHDIASRISGDEFTIALSDRKSTDSAANTAVKVGERILHALQQPFFIEQRELFLTGSIGISIYPNDGETVTELLKNADMAMYHAKDGGRNNVQFFDEQMNKKAVELLEIENDLRYAIERGELELYYQPQYAASDCKMQGVEALLRWHHATKGMIPPGHFIPIIEDTGLIIPIGEWVLRQACSDMAKWQKNNIAVNRMAVNVSARQFKQPGFIDLVQEVIEESNIDPNQLELELTESLLIDDLEHTLDVLTRLRAMGVRMAIDDFGTGYSSLNYLKQFPVDTLKIDQSFIQNLPGNNDDAQITRTIIAMAHNLGLGVIAEGVETKEQLEFLQQVDCEEVQGFYFSKPVPAATLVENINKKLDS